MLILPAIDLQAGRCVRLLRGAFEDSTDYGAPETQLQAFAAAGATWLHIVDLDGAEAGALVQQELVCALARASLIRVQCGGGVRERADVATLLDGGVTRVVIGSLAVKDPAEVTAWLHEFGAERICVALDVRAARDGWEVAVSGWRDGSGVSLAEAVAAFAPGVLKHVLVTDISRDGALTGANVTLIGELSAMRPDLKVQASGGVATLTDLVHLKAAGAGAAIVGRALYERQFSLEAALAV